MIQFYFGSVVLGVEHMHNKHIAHYGISQKNMVVTNSGILKITNFTHAYNDKECSGLRGGPEYMAPEVAKNIEIVGTTMNRKNNSYDKRADLWSIGVFLYYMIEGEQLFRGSYSEIKDFEDLDNEKRNPKKPWGYFFGYGPCARPAAESALKTYKVSSGESRSEQSRWVDLPGAFELVSGLLTADVEKRWTIQDVRNCDFVRSGKYDWNALENLLAEEATK